ncbi:pyridoxal phosphate-dependent transferase [Colletotrichum godetiae]|uniref:Pyridoxal phosphate-dependent transferase n=1 Tax=Colletotrichum godetiae TaxID=1209918 RepID=A0AAJ0ABY3_9PEZI|nr:pyridoxal phosphate-dependent transferase [Colletotrichum godetiae]KAK1659744.1 pyridoxal phosphate-dependent transferase [Colletotrichum godetiae]
MASDQILALALTPFGKPMREKYFLFAKDYTNVNQGSFGGYSSPVRNAEPDRFIRYVVPDILRRSRSLLADFMRCPMDELVLCPNVTTATNTVLLNIRWEDGDKIVYTSGVYGALAKTIEAVIEAQPSVIGVSGVKLQLDLPLVSEKIVALFREAMQNEKLKCKQVGKGRVRLAVFDTIISLPGLMIPFEEMVRVCREEGVFSMIDAAHGIGHIPLNLGKLDPDFFVTNCHKWLFIPRFVAAFYVPKRNQHMIRTTLTTSHGFRPPAARQVFDPMPSSGETNPMVKQFEYFGTIDNAPYCCIETALNFREKFCGGEDAIWTYCTDLAREAGRILVESLGTETFGIPEEERVFFAHVRLPVKVGDDASAAHVSLSDVPAVTEWINRQFVETYLTYLSLLFYRGSWWARLSVAVYVDIEDCRYIAKVLKELSERVQRGEYKH